MTMKSFNRPVLVGISIGLIVCAAGWMVEARAGAPPAGSDPLMASAIIFDLGAAPLSLLTGGLVYRAKQSVDSGIAWRLLDTGQVLLNWVLIALLISWLWEFVRIHRRREA
jgi:hypothetical protein